MRKSIYLKFCLIIILAAAAFYIAYPNSPEIRLGGWTKQPPDLKLGLDLQGGTHLVYEGDLKDIAEGARTDALNAARDVIERRVNAYGVSEPVVQISGGSRIIVELPGVKNINEAIALIGQTPFLEFREENPNPPEVTPNDQGEIIIDALAAFSPTGLTGKELERVTLEFDPRTNVPTIALHFDAEGSKKFADITARNINRRVGIFLDNQLLSAPVVNESINNGTAVITGQFTVNEAKELVTRLNSGALPLPIKLIEQQNVGATLGLASVQKSGAAGLIGFVMIALFMVIYYRLPGVLAVAALLLYSLIVLAIFKIVGVTLTLAGIAGFILSVGMAVDANILIFERLKEELRRGKPLNLAIEEGFRRAWLSVRDSNVSSLITTFILGYFGTSIIRGFALTLSIGILVSMFTAIILTRTFLRISARFEFLSKPKYYSVK